MEWNKQKQKLIQEMLDDKKSDQYICKLLEITPVNLRQIIFRYDLKRPFKQVKGNPQILKKLHEKEDLATRIRILKGEEIRSSSALCNFTDEQLIRWKDNTIECCDLFCEEVLGITLQPYQLNCIYDMIHNKRFVGVMGRQSGKDFLLSCFVTWQSIINSNSKILLVSASQRASDLLYNRILGFIGQSNELYDSVDKSNMEKCIFKNNSEVWSLPATGQIRGQTEVTHIIVNEAFEVPDDTFSAVEPMLALKNGFLYIYSTPRGCVGRLWMAFNDPLFAKVQLPSSVNKYISKEFLELQQKTMDSLEYSMEFEAQFQEAVDCFFPLSLLKLVSKDYQLRNYPIPQEGKKYFLAIDWGRTSDSSVLTILSRLAIDQNLSEYKVENVIEFQNLNFPEQQRRIFDLHNKWHFTKICPEWNGLGIPSCDWLQENIGRDIVKIFKSDRNTKPDGYNKLRKAMEDQIITIPKNHTKLQQQLRTLQYNFTASNYMKIYGLNHDDFPDSLMMAFDVAHSNRRKITCHVAGAGRY